MPRAIVLLVLLLVLAAGVDAQSTPSGNLRDPASLKKDPYWSLPTASTQLENAVQRIVFAGVANHLQLWANNPRDAPLVGSFQLHGNDFGPNGTQLPPPLNVTQGSFTIPAHGRVILYLTATPSAAQDHLGIQAELDGSVGNWTGPARSQFDWEVRPAVSVRLTSPAPQEGLATIKQLFRGGGGNDQGIPVAPVGAQGEVEFRATVENLGHTTASLRLRLGGFDQKSVGPDVTVADLAPGRSQSVSLGKVAPLTLNPKLVHEQGQSQWGFNVNTIVTDPSGSEQSRETLGFRLKDGVVTEPSVAAVSIVVHGAFSPDLQAPPRATLAAAVPVVLNVTNFGTTDVTNRAVDVVFSPPFHALYAVQKEESRSFTVTVAPGGSYRQTLEFTPHVSGQWEMAVQWPSSQGPNGLAKNVYSIDVPTRIDVRIPGTASTHVALGAETQTGLALRAFDDFQDATLRVAAGAAPADSQNGGGDGPIPGQSSIGGLTAQVIQIVPDEVHLGNLAKGVDTPFTIRVTGRGSGTYFVVPYVVVGENAYTGGVYGPGDPVPADTASAALQVTVDPRNIPPQLALAPALGVVIAFSIAYFVRRLVVK